MRSKYLFIPLLGLILLASSCSVSFNFTGGSVDTSLETLFVDNFSNEAEIVVPYLGILTTEKLQDRFLTQSRLSLTSGNADVALGGAITRYTVLPTAISGQDRAEQNRMTIAIRVNFENNQDANESWEQTFSSYIDFDASLDLSSVEREQIEEILDQITQDIFSKSIGKW
ncbi:MAG: LptE family protein [Bacteroidota bacterium]